MHFLEGRAGFGESDQVCVRQGLGRVDGVVGDIVVDEFEDFEVGTDAVAEGEEVVDVSAKKRKSIGC